MHNNQKFCEYRVKTLNWKCYHVTQKELSMDKDAAPRNMASRGNTIFQKAFR